MDYFCNQGYSLQGSSRVFCNQNGQLGSIPTCQQGDTFWACKSSAYKLTFIINTLFILLTKMNILIFTVCTCSGPPSISNGDFSPRQGTYNCGAFVDYSCNQGFSLQGSSRVTCNQNRQWGPAPTCQRGKFEICNTFRTLKYCLSHFSHSNSETFLFYYQQCAHVETHQQSQMVVPIPIEDH